MLRDAEYFKSKLGGLDGAGDAGDYIVGLVKGKSLPRPKSVTASNLTEMKDNTVTNKKSSGELPCEVPGGVTEKGGQEAKQLEEVTEQKAA